MVGVGSVRGAVGIMGCARSRSEGASDLGSGSRPPIAPSNTVGGNGGVVTVVADAEVDCGETVSQMGSFNFQSTFSELSQGLVGR